MVWIPVNEPLLNEDDFSALEDTFRSGWISSAGPYVDEFESGWSAFCGQTHGVAVSNGTTALQVAVEAVGIGTGDEVIMPSYTIISCASAVVRAGGVPVLVDCRPDTFCMDVGAIEARVTTRTKAIMVVHMFGHPVDMDPVVAIAEKYGLVIIATRLFGKFVAALAILRLSVFLQTSLSPPVKVAWWLPAMRTMRRARADYGICVSAAIGGFYIPSTAISSV
jgi:DegT/DnrJ/EryC1/StrS aminotransferase family